MNTADDVLFRHILYPKRGLEMLPKEHLYDLHVAGAKIMAKHVSVY